MCVRQILCRSIGRKYNMATSDRGTRTVPQKQLRIISVICIVISFVGYVVFEQDPLFFTISSLGFTFMALGLLTEEKPRLCLLFIFTLALSLATSFGAPFLMYIGYRVALATLVEGLTSWILPLFLFGSLIFNVFKAKLAEKWIVLDTEEWDREDTVLLRSVAFLQSTFFILMGFELLQADFWFIASFLTANILFFVFRGYAVIRKSNKNRYRSVVVLTSLPAFDILFVLRDWIMELLMFVPAPMFVPIPFSWIFLILTVVTFGWVFGFLRVILLNRYELPQDVFF